MVYVPRKKIDMGCNTVGFVLTKEKDLFRIWDAVNDSLVNSAKEKTGLNYPQLFLTQKKYTSPTCELSSGVHMLNVDFTYDDEKRNMSLHTKCDDDYSYYKKGKKIIVSLGAWGSSVDIIQCVLNGLSVFGKTYITDNDCSEIWREYKPK